MKHVEVVAAIIINNDKILCVQRSPGKFSYISMKYEFPGGKVEPNESNEEALKREIKEELHMEIDVRNHFQTVQHQYPDFSITMYSFICSCAHPELKLEVHVDYKWLAVGELGALDWAAADIPIVEKLMEKSS
jgi:8-oxo-dGTP diphosphatase